MEEPIKIIQDKTSNQTLVVDSLFKIFPELDLPKFKVQKCEIKQNNNCDLTSQYLESLKVSEQHPFQVFIKNDKQGLDISFCYRCHVVIEGQPVMTVDKENIKIITLKDFHFNFTERMMSQTRKYDEKISTMQDVRNKIFDEE